MARASPCSAMPERSSTTLLQPHQRRWGAIGRPTIPPRRPRPQLQLGGATSRTATGRPASPSTGRSADRLPSRASAIYYKTDGLVDRLAPAGGAGFRDLSGPDPELGRHQAQVLHAEWACTT
jgi:hypothetical protein